MNTQYYKTKDLQSDSNRNLQSIYVGFQKDFSDLDSIVQALESNTISNQKIIITENQVIFEIVTNARYMLSKTKSLKNFRKACGLKGIIYRQDYYAKQCSTCTAQKIINENKVNENQFDYNTFVCVHDDTLVVEHLFTRETISLQLENISVQIDNLETERIKEIRERVQNLFLL